MSGKMGEGSPKLQNLSQGFPCVEKYSGNGEDSRKFTDVSTRETFDSIYKTACQLPTLASLGNLMLGRWAVPHWRAQLIADPLNH